MKKNIRTKSAIIVATILPISYIIVAMVTRDPDFISYILGPFGFVIWLVQWIPYLIGGWILAVISTIIFFIIIGYLLGLLIGFIIDKIK